MSTQDKIFLEKEGDAWFQRNKEALGKPGKLDWPLHCIGLLNEKDKIKTVAEVGCANGFRLAALKNQFKKAERFVGIEASAQAIAAGSKQYPQVEFIRGTLSDLPTQDEFDLVIVSHVLHWVDRSTLSRSVAEIDRITRDGGILILGDFLPDFPQRRRYHHLEQENVYTYKQDYAKIFESLGLYKEILRFSYEDGTSDAAASSGESSSRRVCTALKKQTNGYYPEIP
jgi:SAM-dependent methyltransferase